MTNRASDNRPMISHRTMICNPLDWPKYPILPLKRPVEGQNWPQLAVIYANTVCMTPRPKDKNKADPDRPFTIYLIAMYQKKTADTPSITYENIDKLLADGWIVD